MVVHRPPDAHHSIPVLGNESMPYGISGGMTAGYGFPVAAVSPDMLPENAVPIHVPEQDTLDTHVPSWFPGGTPLAFPGPAPTHVFQVPTIPQAFHMSEPPYPISGNDPYAVPGVIPPYPSQRSPVPALIPGHVPPYAFRGATVPYGLPSPPAFQRSELPYPTHGNVSNAIPGVIPPYPPQRAPLPVVIPGRVPPYPFRGAAVPYGVPSGIARHELPGAAPYIQSQGPLTTNNVLGASRPYMMPGGGIPFVPSGFLGPTILHAAPSRGRGEEGRAFAESTDPDRRAGESYRYWSTRTAPNLTNADGVDAGGVQTNASQNTDAENDAEGDSSILGAGDVQVEGIVPSRA